MPSFASSPTRSRSSVAFLLGQFRRRRVRIRVLAEPDRFTVDGTPKSAAELERAVAEAVKSGPRPSVMVTAADPVPYSRVRKAIAAARSAGARAIAMDVGDAGARDGGQHPAVSRTGNR